LWAYGRSERAPTGGISGNAPFGRKNSLLGIQGDRPDLVVIQSESFFDIRRIYPELIREEILGNFDVLKSQAVSHGRLNVAAWGANTVRTEFSFLSGMAGNELKVHQYNPYRKLVTNGFPTLASYVKSLGYRTICIHPYHRSFYGRDKALPLLGFEEFIGIEAFDEAKRDGAYVGDRALADYVIKLLGQESVAPLYVHVITMENHGPLHWESVDQHDAAAVLKGPIPDDCRDIVAYARHLNNADAMFDAIRRELMIHSRPSALCIYGDHVPIMPRVYTQLGEVDGLTDYVLWRSDMQGSSVEQTQDVSTLAVAFLRAADVK
jgi:phosphoglycerol transferase MdoB-like AlkP superfamily enzyme